MQKITNRRSTIVSWHINNCWRAGAIQLMYGNESTKVQNPRRNSYAPCIGPEGCDTDGNLVRDCEKSVRNHTEIWLEIRNQGLENPVEIRKSARNHEKSEEKSGEITRNTPFLSEHEQ